MKNTELMYACINGSDKIVTLLLKNGANVNLQNTLGVTALMYACVKKSDNIVKGSDKIVTLLLKNKANINLQNNAGNTAGDIATMTGYTGFLKILNSINKVNLEAVSNDEYNRFIKENKTGLGFNYISQEEIELKSFLEEKHEDNIVLVTQQNNATCMCRSDITTFYNNQDDWLYECKGEDRKREIDFTISYVKLPIDGALGYVPSTQMLSMITSKRKMFFIKPQQPRQIITHTIVFAMAHNRRTATAVGTNHCQKWK